MKITYDEEAWASYIYFTAIGPGGVADTATYAEMDVDLDGAGQIVVMRLYEPEDYKFPNRLKYALQHPHVTYDGKNHQIQISFVTAPDTAKTISWEANIDFDSEGQIVGLEILFAEPGYDGDDGRERLHGERSTEHLSKYLVPFDDLY